MMSMPIRTKKLHWKYALLTAFRLRKTGGLVENNVLEALKITIDPPSSPAAASPDLFSRVQSFMTEDNEPRIRKDHNEYTREHAPSPITAAMWNCKSLLRAYEDMSYRSDVGGYYVEENHHLTAPPMKRRGRPYRVVIPTSFTTQYGDGLPYRMCVIAQPRHPGEMRLSGLEVLSLLLLAMECYEIAPNESFQTVRVFAVDSFSVRRLSARIPSAYICTLLQLAKKAAPDELVGEITVEQTPYFDLSNDQELESVLGTLLEDEAKRIQDSDSDSDFGPAWF